MADAYFTLHVAIHDDNPGAALISDKSAALEFKIQDAIGDVLDGSEVEQWEISCQRRIG